MKTETNMNIIDQLESLDFYLLEPLLAKLNKLEITQDEIGEPVNAKYFAVGCHKQHGTSNKSSVIISDVIKLNLLDWDKPITEFIEDVVISLPQGFTVLGSIQSKSNCSEWLKITQVDLKQRRNGHSTVWNPGDFPNLLIVPDFDVRSIISSLKIFLLNHNASYLIPDSKIQTIQSLSDLGQFYCCEVHISLPLLSTNSHESCQLNSNISSIEEIIESNLVVQDPPPHSSLKATNIYTYNASHKTIIKDQNALPIQIPVFFSQGLQPTQASPDEKPSHHFFTSYTIINDDEKSFQKISLHLQTCIFKLKDHEEPVPIQKSIKKRFIDQCNYIKERTKNPTRLFHSPSNSYDFEFYAFKIPQMSLPITLLNTGILHDNNPSQKALRKLWSNVLGIHPLMPFITKNLSLIPIPRNKPEYLKYYHEKVVSPHLALIEHMTKDQPTRNSDSCLGLDMEDDEDHPLTDLKQNQLCPTRQPSKLPVLYHCRGDFYYYHYNQDNFKDSGWGCTYRSLQMLMSWYLVNNYTNKHVLSITEIQEFLKKNDPTHHNLQIGSKSWIGTVEASYLLIMYLGISCKLKYYYGVEEFLRDYDTIFDHFQKVSTPIILSVGNYSYFLTAIQISKCPSSPSNPIVQYLIVDPHYTGKDDPEFIYKKNGVSWKNTNFFKSTSKDKQVNMLLPLNISEKDSQIIY